MWFQVKVRGQPVHVAVAGTGTNAIEACFPIMRALHELEAKWNEDKHDAFHAVNHPLNFVVSRIEGGDWTSSVPAWCTFDVRIGIYPGMDLKGVRTQIERRSAPPRTTIPYPRRTSRPRCTITASRRKGTC